MNAETRVKPIIKEVKTFGDRALFKYTKLYDNADITKNTIRVSKRDIERAYKKTDKKTLEAIKQAAENIKDYCKRQLPKQWMSEKDGVEVGQIIRPLEKVGCYCPGGRYSLPSTALMTVIPAKVAGVKEIIVVSPPRPDNYGLIVAADIAGADMILRIGGSQAIAALAYGTMSVPKVDKIVGPGNIYVTAAKKMVYGDVGIDFLAGPSEVMIYSDKGNPSYIAADMIAQAEHDELASSVFVTTNAALAKKVKKEISRQQANSTARKALRKYGKIIVKGSEDDAFSFINESAPEHLMIEDERQLEKVQNAGSIFIGGYSPVSAGDYASGTNHVLPTNGAARFASGLSVMDFIRMPSVQKISKQGIRKLGSTIIQLAEAEGLKAHANAVRLRI